MTKKQCEVGTSCGNSCINSKKECEVEQLGDLSSGLAESLFGDIIDFGGFDIPSSSAGEEAILLTETVAGSEIEVKITPDDGLPLSDVDFTIDGTFNAEASADKSEKEKRKIAFTTLKMMKKAFEQAEEGSQFRATAYMEDGKQEQRQSLYKKFGFGSPDSMTKQQFAKKVNGKIVPLKLEEIEFSSLSTNNELEELIYDIFFN